MNKVSNSSTCSERWHAEVYAQKLHTSVIEYHNSLIYLSFNLLARIKHLKLLQAVMLSDSLQRACGSYNHQGLTFQTSSFKKVWSVFAAIYCAFDLPHCCQRLHKAICCQEGLGMTLSAINMQLVLTDLEVILLLFFWIILHPSAISYSTCIFNYYALLCILN